MAHRDGVGRYFLSDLYSLSHLYRGTGKSVAMSDLKDNLDATVEKVEDLESVRVVSEDPDAEFGGAEARRKLERKLLLKLDARMFILVIIYILNYVSTSYLTYLRTMLTDVAVD